MPAHAVVVERAVRIREVDVVDFPGKCLQQLQRLALGTDERMAGVEEYAEIGVPLPAHRVDDLRNLGGRVERQMRLEFPTDAEAPLAGHSRAFAERVHDALEDD